MNNTLKRVDGFSLVVNDIAKLLLYLKVKISGSVVYQWSPFFLHLESQFESLRAEDEHE